MSYRLKIKGKTWNKVSYELFDYEAMDFQTSEFNLEKSGVLLRNGVHLKFSNEKDVPENEENEKVFYVDENNGIFNYSSFLFI